MILTPQVLSAVVFALAAPPAFADDGFMAIHMANQKVGSPVAEFWGWLSTSPAPPTADGFMAIHMANQALGSAVTNFWLAESKAEHPAIEDAQLSRER